MQLQSTSADELTNCDREQIQFSAAIQPHGLLLALREPELRIVQCSVNATVLAPHADGLLGRPLDQIIGNDAVQKLRAQLPRLAEGPAEPMLLLRLPAAPATLSAYDVLGHRIDGLLLLEFESVDPAAPAPDVRLLHADLSAIIATLEGATSVQHLLDAAVSHLRALTGFDRVMAYRFAADGSGEVVAEARADDLAPLLGLHYPALDIPLPARRLFKLLWLRYLPDVDYEPVPIEPAHPPGQAHPNDLTYATLRSVSLMYRRYLHNMGVRASVVTTLLKDGQLWGLISCHHHGGPRHLPHDLRGACALLARTLSLLIGAKADLEVADYRADLAQAREALTRSLTPSSPLAPTLCHGRPNLLDAIAADGCAVSFRGELHTAGETPPAALLAPLFDWLAAQQDGADLVAIEALGERYAPLAGHAALAAGLLAVRISPTRPDFIAWFRREQVCDVAWAGDPAHPAERELAADGSVILSPRHSFALWREQVRGRSLPWLDCERDHARALRSAVVEVVLAQTDEIDRINRDVARSKDEFLAMLAHELRNPLAPIRNAVEILQRGADADTVARLSATVSRQVQHLARLVDDLLDVSRITTGKITLRAGAVEVHTVVQAALESVRPQLASKQHALALDPPPVPVWLQADPTRLAQVIGNLLNNAIKYTPPGGHVGVRWRQEDDRLVLSVSDDGIGIAPETLAHVFELFVQDHRTIDRAQGGLGIGLALVRSLVELHGGSVEATSPGVGGGSCFTLRLPVTPVDRAAPPATAGEVVPARRVLVVDDNEDAAETLALVLSLQGHAVRVETSARAAIDAATQFEPDVVFLDIGLPEMDGYAVARALRADPASRDTLLVALTGYGTEGDRQRAREAGFDAHLTKPADMASLHALLSRALPVCGAQVNAPPDR